jgi:hypothetical protein
MPAIICQSQFRRHPDRAFIVSRSLQRKNSAEELLLFFYTSSSQTLIEPEC